MFRKKKNKKPAHELASDLKGLGYYINEEGKLRTIEGDEPYKFEVKERSYNEALYDALLVAIGDWVEESLQRDLGMSRILLPIGVNETDIHSKIYVSPDYATNDKMIVFISGTGHTVGIWSRRVLTDESVTEGSMIAYTKRAMELGFSVVITNPNEVFWYKDKAVLILPKTTSEFNTIPGSESPEAHVEYVFENFVMSSAAQKIVIVANSYGGHCAIDVMQNHFTELADRVKAIEFTASTHSIDFVKTDKMKVWIREHCRNWLMSDEEIGKEIIDYRFGCTSVSSGSDLNEFVTSAVINEVFSFLERKILNDNIDDYVDEDSDQEAEALFSDGGLQEIQEIQEIAKVFEISEKEEEKDKGKIIEEEEEKDKGKIIEEEEEKDKCKIEEDANSNWTS